MAEFSDLNAWYKEYVQTDDPLLYNKIAEAVPLLTKKISTGYLGKGLTLEKDTVIGDVSSKFLLSVKEKKITRSQASTYLHTAVKNRVIDHSRKPREESRPDHYWQNLVLKSKAAPFVENAINRDLRAEIELAIDEAVENPIEKDILKRHYLEGEQLKKLAAEYGFKDSKTKMRMSRLQEKLAELPVFQELYQASNEITRGR